FYGYAVFHFVVSIFCVSWAIIRLRAIALAQTFGKVARLPLLTRIIGRPGVTNPPMLWKELIAEPGMRFGWMGRIFLGLFVLLSFVPPVWMLALFIQEMLFPTGNRWSPWSNWERFGEVINAWVRGAGTGLACVMLLAVAVRAAGSISGERD